MSSAPETNISATFPFEFHSLKISGSRIRYVNVGSEQPSSAPTLLFLHGNSSSSYVWRNIIPYLTSFRCIAPDLIGMGESDKPGHLSYSFSDHYTFVSAFIEAIIPDGQVVIIAHDWGTALGLHWARQHSVRVAGLVLLEFVRPFATWEDFADPETRQHWKTFRDPVKGRELIIQQNLIMGPMIVHAAKRGLTEQELEHYRKPFLEPAAREVIWKWTTQIPIENDPPAVFDIVTQYEKWLLESRVPKLFFYCEDGPLITGDKMRWYMERTTNATSVDVGDAGHFLQEDRPALIRGEILKWLPKVLS